MNNNTAVIVAVLAFVIIGAVALYLITTQTDTSADASSSSSSSSSVSRSSANLKTSRGKGKKPTVEDAARPPTYAQMLPNTRSANSKRYIVHLKDTAPQFRSSQVLTADQEDQCTLNVARSMGIDCPSHCFHVNHHHAFSCESSAAVMAALSSNPNVDHIEEDSRVCMTGGRVSRPVVPKFPPQQVSWAIARLGGDKNSTLAGNGSGGVGTGVNIYVLDTGCTHQDLNVVESRSFIESEPSTADLNGHGTHVAGIAAARDNTIGTVGICPGARIFSYKVLNRFGSGWMTDVAAGVQWVIDHHDRKSVINLSLSGPAGAGSGVLEDAIQAAIDEGIVVVVAAGNETDAAVNHSPARMDDAITVAAYSQNNSFATFSNFGAKVDICAPGVSINSLWLSNSTRSLSGTSMAAPYVAGIVALILLQSPSLTPAQVKAALVAAADNPAYSAITPTNPSVINTPVATTSRSVFAGNF